MKTGMQSNQLFDQTLQVYNWVRVTQTKSRGIAKLYKKEILLFRKNIKFNFTCCSSGNFCKLRFIPVKHFSGEQVIDVSAASGDIVEHAEHQDDCYGSGVSSLCSKHCHECFTGLLHDSITGNRLISKIIFHWFPVKALCLVVITY